MPPQLSNLCLYIETDEILPSLIMSEYTLLATFVILRRRTELDLPKGNRDALKECELSWTEFFRPELQSLRGGNRSSTVVRWRYDDNVYDFIAFVRNRLAHERGIGKVARQILERGDPLNLVLDALLLSRSSQVMPLISDIQDLKSEASTLGGNLRRFDTHN
jgi:hypothetical protein